jgi:hypothetical protein
MTAEGRRRKEHHSAYGARKQKVFSGDQPTFLWRYRVFEAILSQSCDQPKMPWLAL